MKNRLSRGIGLQRQRQGYRKDGAHAFLAAGLDAAFMRLGNILDDRQAKAVAIAPQVTGFVRPVETLEHVMQRLLRYADPVVLHLQASRSVLMLQLQEDIASLRSVR